MSLHAYGPGVGSANVELMFWSIRQFKDGRRYFVGFDPAMDEGRVSSRIVELDPVTRTGVTQNGRRYQLTGPTGKHPDGEYVWGRALARYKDPDEWDDVSVELIPTALNEPA